MRVSEFGSNVAEKESYLRLQSCIKFFPCDGDYMPKDSIPRIGICLEDIVVAVVKTQSKFALTPVNAVDALWKILEDLGPLTRSGELPIVCNQTSLIAFCNQTSLIASMIETCFDDFPILF
jgi:hypothetical protein